MPGISAFLKAVWVQIINSVYDNFDELFRFGDEDREWIDEYTEHVRD